jgi:hypothetical protein
MFDVLQPRARCTCNVAYRYDVRYHDVSQLPEHLSEEEPLSSTGEQLEDHRPSLIGTKNQRKGKAILRCYLLFFAQVIVVVEHWHSEREATEV